MLEEPAGEDALFDVPETERVPRRTVLVLAGASGSGKSSVAQRLGIPMVRLDDFYRDCDFPGLPRSRGTIDWDDARTWDVDAAFVSLRDACFTDRLDLPVYDIPTSRRTGSRTIDVAGAPAIVAEGIFAAEIVEPLRRAGLLFAAYYLAQPRTTTALRRLARDIGEARKPIPTLLRRGFALWRGEPGLVRHWDTCGLVPLPRPGAEDRLKARLTRVGSPGL